MAGTLTVQNLQGPSSGANANKIIIPSGQTLYAPGHVIQAQTKKWSNDGFSTTSATLVDVTDFYIDITPTSSNSIILFQASLTMLNSTVGGYGRFSIIDSNTSTKWSSNSYIAASGYNGSQWADVPLIHTNTAGTTNTMRLQLQGQVGGGGTLDMRWSASDDRTIVAMEIAG